MCAILISTSYLQKNRTWLKATAEFLFILKSFLLILWRVLKGVVDYSVLFEQTCTVHLAPLSTYVKNLLASFPCASNSFQFRALACSYDA